jgi:UDP-4-amino-4,6-dideoxy-N-acetyl-beta-L-altrosamine transaminase
MIPYGCQDIDQSDIDAVIEVLKSDFLTQGPKVPLFEKVVSEKVGAAYAVATNSATSALHIACLALEVGSGDWLWTTPNTFVASANCGLYCGAQIDFVDIDPLTFNLCTSALEQKLIKAGTEDRLPKVLVAVHLSGQSCDMVRIHALSQIYGFKVIEDASHAIGGKYKEQYVGCGQFSDITVFSFHPVKIVTTAEGGMAVTNCHELSEKMALYRSHGITRNPEMMTKSSDGPWYYEQIGLGFNYRMTELQAALGISQMTRIDAFVAKRHEIKAIYDEGLSGLPIQLPLQHPDGYSAMHLYIIRLKLSELRKTRRQIFEALRSDGIGVNVHYIPVHTQPFFKAMGFKEHDFPESVRCYRESISLPMFPSLTKANQTAVITALHRVLT